MQSRMHCGFNPAFSEPVFKIRFTYYHLRPARRHADFLQEVTMQSDQRKYFKNADTQPYRFVTVKQFQVGVLYLGRLPTNPQLINLDSDL